MAETPERLAGRLQNEGEKTLKFFSSLQPHAWQQQLYTEGSCWSVREVLAHFVSTEAAFVRLIKNILAGGPGSPKSFNIDIFNESEVAAFAGNSTEEMLRKFGELRQANAALVAQMSPADLGRTGRHPFLGVAPLEEIIKLLYRHNQIHQRDVRRIFISSEDGSVKPLQ
jgi:hypothetical protein